MSDLTHESATEAQGLVEYSLILLAIALALVFLVNAMGQLVAPMYQAVVNNFPG